MIVELKCKKGEQTSRLQIIAELMKQFPEDVFEIRQADGYGSSVLWKEVSYLTKDIDVKLEINY